MRSVRSCEESYLSHLCLDASFEIGKCLLSRDMEVFVERKTGQSGL